MPVSVRTLLLLLLLFARSGKAQIPVGSWREHLTYRNGIQLALSGDKIYCSTPYSLMVLNRADNVVERLSKVNGLSEIGISTIGADEQSGKLLVAYQNSNLDIVEGNRIYNINDILLKNTVADTKINRAWWQNQQVYLASALGVIVIDASKRQVKDSYVIGDNGNFLEVKGVVADAEYLYAATDLGLKRGSLKTNLADFRQWTTLSGSGGLPSGAVQQVIVLSNKIIAAVADSLWQLNGSSWTRFYADGNTITNLCVQRDKILLTEHVAGINSLVIINAGGTVDQRIDATASAPKPMDALISGGELFVADSLAGLLRNGSGGFQYFSPQSPAGFSDGEIIASAGNLWVAPGTIDRLSLRGNRPAGLFRFSDESWRNYDSISTPVFKGRADVVSLAEDPVSGSLWAGSFGDGLFEIRRDNTAIHYRENSLLRPSEFDPAFYGVGGLAFDRDNNLWLTNYGSASSLVVRESNGNARSFDIPGATFDYAFTRIVIDDDNQKWIIAPKANGVFCFSSGADIDNVADDRWKHFLSGKGNGNLPDNTVLSMVKDKSGFVWVGTTKGIGIIQCTGTIFSNLSCEAELPVVQQDNFAGYLFANEQVQTMAVDGADRKWIGTKNGVWLISRYGEKTLLHFTKGNSPLLDNDVKNVAIDPASGEVFFQTGSGICSYRADATEASATATKVLVFPNPVPPQYSGTIAIRGIQTNAIVKITTLDGRLVHQARANGTTVTWNGLNYQGKSIAAGVYLVLTTDETGREQLATKIVIVK